MYFRYFWGERVIELEFGNIFDIENEIRLSVWKRMLLEKGFIGLFFFYKYFYNFYGFDILNYFFYDVYYIIVWNVVKN